MNPEELEGFVEADEAGEFSSLNWRHLLELARAGKLPGSPIGDGEVCLAVPPMRACCCPAKKRFILREEVIRRPSRQSPALSNRRFELRVDGFHIQSQTTMLVFV